MEFFAPRCQFSQLFIGHVLIRSALQQEFKVSVNIQIVYFRHLDHCVYNCTGIGSLYGTGCSMIPFRKHRQVPSSTVFRKLQSSTTWDLIIILNIYSQSFPNFVTKKEIWILQSWLTCCHGQKSYRMNVENHAADIWDLKKGVQILYSNSRSGAKPPFYIDC